MAPYLRRPACRSAHHRSQTLPSVRSGILLGPPARQWQRSTQQHQTLVRYEWSVTSRRRSGDVLQGLTIARDYANMTWRAMTHISVHAGMTSQADLCEGDFQHKSEILGKSDSIDVVTSWARRWLRAPLSTAADIGPVISGTARSLPCKMMRMNLTCAAIAHASKKKSPAAEHTLCAGCPHEQIRRMRAGDDGASESINDQRTLPAPKSCACRAPIFSPSLT